MAAFVGYGIPDKKNLPEYSIQVAIPDFNDVAYGQYIGLVFTLAFVPTLLFVAPLSGNWNRKLTVGLSSIGWGVCIFLHAFATTKYELYFLFALVGVFQSVGNPLTYILITEYFEPKARVRAFFVFQILAQLGDTIIFLNTDLITMFGWRNSWMICGMFAIIPGVLCTFTIIEPERTDLRAIQVESGDDEPPQRQANRNQGSLIIEYTKGY